MNITKITKANPRDPKGYAVLPLHITPFVLYMHYRSGDKSHLVFSESRIRGRDWGFEFFYIYQQLRYCVENLIPKLHVPMDDVTRA